MHWQVEAPRLDQRTFPARARCLFRQPQIHDRVQIRSALLRWIGAANANISFDIAVPFVFPPSLSYIRSGLDDDLERLSVRYLPEGVIRVPMVAGPEGGPSSDMQRYEG